MFEVNVAREYVSVTLSELRDFDVRSIDDFERPRLLIKLDWHY